MRRILAELLRQTRWIWPMNVAAFTAGFLWFLHLARPAHAGAVLNLCALGADVMSVLVVTTSMDALRMTRPVAALPIRRRDFGASLWLVDVAFPVLLTFATKVLVVGIAPLTSPGAPANLRWLMTSTVFDVAYAGTLCWLIQHAVGRDQSRRVGPWLTRLYWTAVTTALLGGTLALGLSMPTDPGQWSWPIGLALAGMLGLTVTGYIQSERLAVDGGTLGLLFDQRTTEGEHTPAPTRRVPFSDRLSGLRRMLWQQFRNALITLALTTTLLTVMVTLPLSKTVGVWEQLRQAVATMPNEIGAQLWVLPWILYFTIGIKRWLPARMRPLRVLPISARELNLLLLLRPVVTWAAFWLVLLAIYSQSPDSAPAWMGFGWLVLSIGLSGLMGTAMWRWQGSPLTGFVVMGVNYFLLFVHPWTHITSPVFAAGTGQFAGLALGVCGIAAASRWNQRLIAQKSKGRS